MKETVWQHKMRKRVAGGSSLSDRQMKKSKMAERYVQNKAFARRFEEYVGENVDNVESRECLTTDEVEDICKTSKLSPVTLKTKKDVYLRGRKRLEKSGGLRVTCTVCDRASLIQSVRKCKPTGSTAEKWNRRLSGDEDVPLSLRKHYNVSEWFPQLDKSLLSKRGVANLEARDSEKKLYVCLQCYKALKSSASSPPKFSIANGFDIGELPPSLQDSRTIEKRLTSLTSVAHSLIVLRGGKHKCLKGHISVTRMNPTPIAKRLPVLLKEGNEEFLVIMAGNLTPVQEIIGMRRFKARQTVIRDLLSFYAKENCLYQDARVHIDEEALQTLGNDNFLVDLQRVDEGEALSNTTDSFCEAAEGETSKKDLDEDESNGLNESEEDYCETSSIYVDSTPQTSIEVLEEARKTVLVRNRGDFVSDYDKKMFGLAFPDLFPYGRGHPGTHRSIAVSLEECCRYYLDLSSRHFAQHNSFLLIAFDVCGRRRVVTSTSIRSLHYSEEFERFGEVTKEELAEALQEKRSQREQALSGVSVSPRSGNKSPAAKFLHQVKVSQASMWGSAEERLVYRRQAFSMDAFPKTGAVFVTITPSDVGTLQVAAIAGFVSHENIRSLELGELPDRAKRAAIAGIDPLACENYFEQICEAFIEDVVAFDRKKGLPYKGGGVFGVVKAFLGVVEAQNSGNLHLHAILFVAGLPRTVSGFANKCEDAITGEDFKSSLCALIDSVVSSTVSCSPVAAQKPPCPHCKSVTGLVPKTKIHEAAFEKHRRNQRPFPTSACIHCNFEFGACEVLRSEVEQLHISLDSISGANSRRIPLGENYRDTDRLTELSCMKPSEHLWPPETESIDSEIGRLHRLSLARIILLTQQHSHRHVDSCFKSSCYAKTGQCRYGFPRSCEKGTRIDVNGCLVLKRGIHNEYINGFNEVIALLFCTNHDIRFLLGGTADALYYVMKYVTKGPAIPSGVESAMISSYDRRRKIEQELVKDGTPMSLMKTGRSRVNSMVAALIKMQQVPAPLCALYLRRKSALYSSHGFAKLLLSQSMAIVRREKHESELVTNNDGNYVRAPQYMDYVCRPTSLEKLCMMEFVSLYMRVRISKKVSSLMEQSQDSGECLSGLFLFRKEHPLNRTHCLKKRDKEVIPDLIGPRFPNKERLETTEQREMYGIMALILLFPFGYDTDIRQGSNSYWESFKIFSEKMPKRSRDILENFQEYFLSKKSSVLERSVASDTKAMYTADMERQSRENLDCIDHIDTDTMDLNKQWDEEGSFADFGVRSSLAAIQGFELRCSNAIVDIANQLTTRHSVQICAKFNVRKETEGPPWPECTKLYPHSDRRESPSELAAELHGKYLKLGSIVDEEAVLARKDEHETSSSEGKFDSSCDHCSNTTIACLSNELLQASSCITNSKGSFPSNTPFSCNHFAPIAHIAKLFSLNELQTKAFSLLSKELLCRFTEGLVDEKRDKTFTMYLGGEGGTGKTRVVEALQYFSKSWKRQKTVRTCAPTGIAASLVDGSTIHSLLGLSPGRAYNTRKKVGSKQLEEYAETLLLIVDEVSMLSAKMLGELDVFLRKVKESDSPFGGAMALFVGDFFQIPPVASPSLFSDPELRRGKSSIQEKMGYHLWKSIQHVIVLTESMRQREEPRFCDFLRRLRYGKVTKADLEFLNSRVVTPFLLPELRSCRKGYVPLIVRSNALRQTLNWNAVRYQALEQGCKPIVCVAEILTSTGKRLPMQDLNKIFRAADTETCNLAALLPLIPGMPIRITQNISITLGIANGTTGTLEGVTFGEEANFDSTMINGVDCLVSSEMPQLAYISSPLFEKKLEERFPCLPEQYSDDTIPVAVVKRDEISWRLRKTLQSTNNISLQQLPFVPAYSSTTYKVQGATADGVVVFPFLKECKRPPPSATMYVVCSRVRKISSLFLLQQLTEEDMKHFVPSEELLHENERLLKLHDRTLDKLRLAL